MTWGRLDDGFHGHPKTAETSLAAIGLLALGISYAADYLTDGLLPATFMRHRAHGRTGKAAVCELVERGWLEPTDDGGYRIHDFLDFNPSREEVEAARAKQRVKKRRQRSTGRLWNGDLAVDGPPGTTPLKGESGLGTTSAPSGSDNGEQWQIDAGARLVEVFASLGLMLDIDSAINAVARFPSLPHEQVGRGAAEYCRAHREKPTGHTLHRYFETEAAKSANGKRTTGRQSPSDLLRALDGSA